MTEDKNLRNLFDKNENSDELQIQVDRRSWLNSLIRPSGALATLGLFGCDVQFDGKRFTNNSKSKPSALVNPSAAQQPPYNEDQAPSPSSPSASELTGPQTDPTPTPTANPTPSPELAEDCNPLTIRTVDLEKYPAAPLNRNPTVMLYGRDSSAMLVLGLNQYDHLSTAKKITQIILVRGNSQILAMHALTQADVRTDGSLRPIVFDHLNLKSDKRLHLLFLDSDSTYSKIITTMDWAFVNTFRNEPVRDLATLESIPSDFGTHQGIPNLEEDMSQGFVGSSDHIFSDQRLLFTAQSNARYKAAQRLSGWIITDLFGYEIANGNQFIDILEHPTFICFRKHEGQWFRTMVKVG